MKKLCFAFLAIFIFQTTVHANLNANDSLLNVPAGSVFTFTKDIIIPANKNTILLGSSKAGSFITECYLAVNRLDINNRQIKSGTKYYVRDTAQGFNSKVDLLFDSKSVQSIACESYNYRISQSSLPSEYDIAAPKLSQAQKAMSGIVKLEISKELKVIND
jgi:hypothetical protein